jgi:hypothetical protein
MVKSEGKTNRRVVLKYWSDWIENQGGEKKMLSQQNQRSIEHTHSWAWRGHWGDFNVALTVDVWLLSDVVCIARSVLVPPTCWRVLTSTNFFNNIYIFLITNYPSIFLIITKKNNENTKKTLKISEVKFDFKGNLVILLFWKSWND